MRAREDRERAAQPTPAHERRKPRESPVHGLYRLREKLAAGERDEFPESTITLHGRSYLVVERSKTWEEAQQYAELHGAHLASLPSRQLRAWFRDRVDVERTLWLGGRPTHDSSRWTWIDGSKWNGKDDLREEDHADDRLALAPSGKLVPTRRSERMHFILQWRNDGTFPASLDAQLARTAASAAARKNTDDDELVPLLLPYSALTWGTSHYLYLEREMSWNDARKFALALGAHLAAPSTPAEHEWICETFKSKLRPQERLWLGGYRLKPTEPWQWLTKEDWSGHGWRRQETENHPERDRLALYRATETAGWVAHDGESGGARGFLLEWTTPEKE